MGEEDEVQRLKAQLAKSEKTRNTLREQLLSLRDAALATSSAYKESQAQLEATRAQLADEQGARAAAELACEQARAEAAHAAKAAQAAKANAEAANAALAVKAGGKSKGSAAAPAGSVVAVGAVSALEARIKSLEAAVTREKRRAQEAQEALAAAQGRAEGPGAPGAHHERLAGFEAQLTEVRAAAAAAEARARQAGSELSALRVSSERAAAAANKELALLRRQLKEALAGSSGGSGTVGAAPPAAAIVSLRRELEEVGAREAAVRAQLEHAGRVEANLKAQVAELRADAESVRRDLERALHEARDARKAARDAGAARQQAQTEVAGGGARAPHVVELEQEVAGLRAQVEALAAQLRARTNALSSLLADPTLPMELAALRAGQQEGGGHLQGSLPGMTALLGGAVWGSSGLPLGLGTSGATSLALAPLLPTQPAVPAADMQPGGVAAPRGAAPELLPPGHQVPEVQPGQRARRKQLAAHERTPDHSGLAGATTASGASSGSAGGGEAGARAGRQGAAGVVGSVDSAGGVRGMRSPQTAAGGRAGSVEPWGGSRNIGSVGDGPGGMAATATAAAAAAQARRDQSRAAGSGLCSSGGSGGGGLEEVVGSGSAPATAAGGGQGPDAAHARARRITYCGSAANGMPLGAAHADGDEGNVGQGGVVGQRAAPAVERTRPPLSPSGAKRRRTLAAADVVSAQLEKDLQGFWSGLPPDLLDITQPATGVGPAKRGRPVRSRSGQELLAGLHTGLKEPGVRGASRSAAAAIRKTAKAVSKALGSAACGAPELFSAVLGSVLGCAAPCVSLEPQGAGDSVAGGAPEGARGWGGWCTPDAWGRGTVAALMEVVVGAEQHLAVDQAAAAAAAAAAAGMGVGNAVPRTTQVQHITLVQPLLSSMAARCLSGLTSGAGPPAGGGALGGAALPLEAPERCAFAAAHTHLAQLSGRREAVRGLVADLLSAAHSSRRACTLVLPMLYAVLSVWPDALVCPRGSSLVISAPGVGDTGVGDGEQALAQQTGNVSKGRGKRSAASVANTAVQPPEVSAGFPDPLGAALLAGVADVCDAVVAGRGLGQGRQLVVAEGAGSDDGSSSGSGSDSDSDGSRDSGRRRRSAWGAQAAPLRSLSVGSLASSPAWSPTQLHALAHALAGCIRMQYTCAIGAWCLQPHTLPLHQGSIDATAHGCGQGAGTSLQCSRARWGRVCAAALGVLHRTLTGSTCDGAAAAPELAQGGDVAAQIRALCSQAQAALLLSVRHASGWDFQYNSVVRVLLGWLPSLPEAGAVVVLQLVGSIAHAEQQRIQQRSTLNTRSQAAGGGASQEQYLGAGGADALLSVCQQLGGLLHAEGRPPMCSSPGAQAAGAVAVTWCAGLVVTVCGALSTSTLPASCVEAERMSAAVRPTVRALQAWAAQPPVPLSSLPSGVAAMLLEFATFGAGVQPAVAEADPCSRHVSGTGSPGSLSEGSDEDDEDMEDPSSSEEGGVMGGGGGVVVECSQDVEVEEI